MPALLDPLRWILHLSLKRQPEAAALASLYESKPSIDAGDVFIICDAGGGTVVSWH